MLPLRSFATLAELYYWLVEKVSGTYPASHPDVPLNTFGFFMAVCVIAASFPLVSELKRRKALGVFQGRVITVVSGKKPGIGDVAGSLALGFLLGYKLFPIAAQWHSVSHDVRGFLLSAQGNLLAGIVAAIALGAYEFYKLKKQELPKPLEKKMELYPHDMLGELIMVIVAAGFVGMKFFEIIDTPGGVQDFLHNPAAALFSGFTIVGGIVFCMIAIPLWAHYRGVHKLHLFDSIASVFMLAYAIGRQGCQLSGDGDWGIATTGFTKPVFIPDFLWGQTYAHNVIHAGEPIAGCTENYCSVLSVPHFPAPVYETILSLIIFFALWSVRKKITHIPGLLFALFCIGNGLERFFIEFIRETNKKSWAMNLSQQQIISLLLIIGGIIFSIYLWNNSKRKEPNQMQL